VQCNHSFRKPTSQDAIVSAQAKKLSGSAKKLAGLSTDDSVG